MGPTFEWDENNENRERANSSSNIASPERKRPKRDSTNQGTNNLQGPYTPQIKSCISGTAEASRTSKMLSSEVKLPKGKLVFTHDSQKASCKNSSQDPGELS